MIGVLILVKEVHHRSAVFRIEDVGRGFPPASEPVRTPGIADRRAVAMPVGTRRCRVRRIGSSNVEGMAILLHVRTPFMEGIAVARMAQW